MPPFKRKRIKTVKARKQQFKLILDKNKWIKGSSKIKEYREEHKTDTCPITGLEYGEGMDSCVLDHDHDSGKCRGPISSRSNLMLGRIELYYRKLLSKTEVPLVTILKNMVQYLKDAEQVEPKLHGEIIEVEKRRLARWKNETIYYKLLLKGLDLLPIDKYTKHDLVTLHIQQFINEKEKEIGSK